ncbi:MAG: RNA polymerase sigma factor [Clostridium sp.]
MLNKGDKHINDEILYLIKNILSLIYKYLISIGSSKEDAEDIIQETFIKAYENIDILIDGNLKAWMFKVSLNKFYTLYKKSKTKISLTDELSNSLKTDFQITDIDNSLDINNILSKMSESQKNLLILKYEIGLSYTNISKLLNISESSAKTLCYRARNKFKEIWRSEKYE